MDTQIEKTVTSNASAAFRRNRRRLTRAHLAVLAHPRVVAQTRAAMEATATALAAQLGCPVKLEGRLLPGREVVLADPACFALFELSGAGSKALLEIEPSILAALLEKLCGGEGNQSIAFRLTQIEEAAFGYLLLLVVRTLRGSEPFLKELGPRLTSLATNRREATQAIESERAHVAMEIAIQAGEARGIARVYVPADRLQLALEAQPLAQPNAIADEVLLSKLALRAFVGRAALSQEELSTLQRGDVVLFDGVGCSSGLLVGAGRLLNRTFELLGAWGPDGFTFRGGKSRGLLKENEMRMDLGDVVEAAERLPVEVEIELARVQLPLADLARLSVGGVLPLRVGVADPVLLRVGDRAVARAELVEIDGEVGARILALLS